MKVISSFLILVLIAAATLLVSSFVSAQAQNPCNPYWVRGHLVEPSTWGYSYDLYNFNNGSTTAYFGIDLCNNQVFTAPPNTTGPPSGYITSIPNQGSFPQLTFDEFFSVRTDEYETVYTYGSSAVPRTYAQVLVHCNSSYPTIKPTRMNPIVRNETFANGDSTLSYVFHMGVAQLCHPPTTAAPPATPAPPAGPTTAVPSVPCPTFDIDTQVVNPNLWGNVMGVLNVPAFPGSSTTVMGNICNMNPSFTPAPSYTQHNGYFVIAPYGSVFQPIVFDNREHAMEINSAVPFAKFRFNSTYDARHQLSVYVFCDPTHDSIHIRDNDLSYYNNSRGGVNFEMYLGVSSMCKTATTAAPAQCSTFVNKAGETKNPEHFRGGQSLVKNVMTGDSVMALVDLCHAHHFTPIPGTTFAPGYVIFYPGAKDPFPQISFDWIKSFMYLDFNNELRVSYGSSMTNHTQDEAIVSVTCGGGNGLTFLNRYIFPRHNTRGGNTYMFELATQSMCTSPATTGVPTPAPLPPATPAPTPAPATPVPSAAPATPAPAAPVPPPVSTSSSAPAPAPGPGPVAPTAAPTPSP